MYISELLNDLPSTLDDYQLVFSGHAITNVACFPLLLLGFDPRSSHVGFVVDKVALGKISCEYFSDPWHSLSH
jgi:hypothetical protein